MLVEVDIFDKDENKHLPLDILMFKEVDIFDKDENQKSASEYVKA